MNIVILSGALVETPTVSSTNGTHVCRAVLAPGRWSGKAGRYKIERHGHLEIVACGTLAEQVASFRQHDLIAIQGSLHRDTVQHAGDTPAPYAVMVDRILYAHQVERPSAGTQTQEDDHAE